jgi:hypothetical protein
MNVATLDEFRALERRVAAIESRSNRQGSCWIPVAKSPLGSRKTRRLIAADKLEASRVGRLLYVRVADVDRFLEQRIAKREAPTLVPVETDDPTEYAKANLHMLRRTA